MNQPFITAQNISSSGARPSTIWAAAAKTLRSLQTADLQQHHVRSWDAYPSNRWGWVADSGRLLGVGHCAKSQGRQGERIARINLPYYGSGRELREDVRKYIAKIDRKFRVVSIAA